MKASKLFVSLIFSTSLVSCVKKSGEKAASEGTETPPASAPADQADAAKGFRYDPCALFTQADAEAVIGTRLPEKKLEKSATHLPQQSCYYSSVDGKALASLTLYDGALMPSDSDYQADFFYRPYRKLADEGFASKILDLGDEACHDKTGIVVLLREKNISFFLSVLRPFDATSKQSFEDMRRWKNESERSLAKQVLSRL